MPQIEGRHPVLIVLKPIRFTDSNDLHVTINFFDVTMCSLVNRYQRFEGPSCLNRQTFTLKREAEICSETLTPTYQTVINVPEV
jgi:hypothetical protein